jgi:hypothetical protein
VGAGPLQARAPIFLSQFHHAFEFTVAAGNIGVVEQFVPRQSDRLVAMVCVRTFRPA